MSGLAEFIFEYRMSVAQIMAGHTHEEHLRMADPMIVAIKSGVYNKGGDAMRATCARLGIKNSYTDIDNFLRGE